MSEDVSDSDVNNGKSLLRFSNILFIALISFSRLAFMKYSLVILTLYAMQTNALPKS